MDSSSESSTSMFWLISVTSRVEAFGDKDVFEEDFGWAKQKVIENRGAEFILEDGYEYVFDREEEVFNEKYGRMFGANGRQLVKRSEL